MTTALFRCRLASNRRWKQILPLSSRFWSLGGATRPRPSVKGSRINFWSSVAPPEAPGGWWGGAFLFIYVIFLAWGNEEQVKRVRDERGRLRFISIAPQERFVLSKVLEQQPRLLMSRCAPHVSPVKQAHICASRGSTRPPDASCQ